MDDLKSSRSIRGTPGPNFELLDAKIASALNRIIQNNRFKKKVSLEEQKKPQKRIAYCEGSQIAYSMFEKKNRFLRGRQIAFMIYEYFRVTGAKDSVENYADLFTVVLRNDDIQEVDSKWDGILVSMTKIPSDDILEGLCKLRIRGSEKLRPYWNCTKWRFIRRKPDLIITMVKISIEQEIRNKNFEARNGNYERNAVVENQGTKQRGQKSRRLLAVESQREVFERRQLYCPSRCQ